MVYTPLSYSRPSMTQPGSERLPDAEDLPPVNIPGARLKYVKKLWFKDHPLCGYFFGCDRGCPRYSPVPKMGQVFPHCGHPDARDEKYLP